MLLTLADCKALLGITHSSHDAYIERMIESAQSDIEGYIRQPIERRQISHVAPCAASATYELGVVPLVGTIDVDIISVTSAIGDVTAYSAAQDGVLLVPTDCIGYMVSYTIETGWTEDSVPQIVRTVIARLVWYYYRQTGLAAINTAGLSSLSTSDGGVVVSSRSYDEHERDSILSLMDQWRRL